MDGQTKLFSLFWILIVRALVRLVTLANQIIDPSMYISYFHCSDYGCNLQTKHRLLAFKFEVQTISQQPLPIWLMQSGKWNSNLVSSNRQWSFVYLTLSHPEALLWRIKSPGIRQSKITKCPLLAALEGEGLRKRDGQVGSVNPFPPSPNT